ncbi:transporter substrate-binding domain-containing protein [Hahella aquimaris]|uniref:substrate-binding periplasmic protein n=1 Tax=Hahella sp. HNIBRBA332 TaxID=3015983 RepID=UPI00273C2922|nr:transporter substrate-binding domain-containing protein [Hahella sp. HNIBRBA332]WLQ12335.1 transporter substrate-binding domain-containing protein [Hahella sp. HNIBRBA332]
MTLSSTVMEDSPLSIKGKLGVLLVTITLALCSLRVFAADIKVVTTDFPPYSFEENGDVGGMATEVVKAVLAKSGVSISSFRVFPWARAYKLAQTEPNTLIYSIARSPEREPLFKWVGEIAPFRVNLYKLKSRTDINISSLEDAKRYIVGGEYQDIKQGYLVKQGFEVGKNIVLMPEDELNIRMLFAKRIDLIPFSEFSLPIMLKQEGFSPAEVENVLTLDDISYNLYMACSLETPDVTVDSLRRALQTLWDKGEIQAIQQKYLNPE